MGETQSTYVEVHQPGTKWLLFKYDPLRKLIEIQRKGRLYYVDLKLLDEQARMKERIRLVPILVEIESE